MIAFLSYNYEIRGLKTFKNSSLICGMISCPGELDYHDLLNILYSLKDNRQRKSSRNFL